jgi:hypothetical protein
LDLLAGVLVVLIRVGEQVAIISASATRRVIMVSLIERSAKANAVN